ncbi:MAG: TolC family protein [Deltaproteobacteria bacterium]|nr:TolC family protein [Deltaproteobacteria bacterium]
MWRRSISGAIVLACSMLFTVSFLWAGEGNRPLSLDESIKLAIERSVILDSAKEGIKAAEANKKGAFTGFLPKLSTSYSYTRLDEAPSMLGIQTGVRDNYTWQMNVTQPVFAGGKILANYRINSMGTEIARFEEKATVQNISLEVKIAYFNILKAERILQVARQSVEQLRAHRDIAQSFFDVGIIPKNDLLYAEVELANGAQDLVRAENSLQLAKARFNKALRQDIDKAVSVVDILMYEPFDLELSDCFSRAFDNRPEISIVSLQELQAEELVKAAEGDYYPSVNMVANYSRYGDDPGVSGTPYRDEDEWYLMAVAQWNFWEWGRTKYSVDAGKSKKRQAMNALIDIKDGVSLDVKNAYLNLREAEKRISVTKKAIEQAEENYRINVERYKEQVATSTDVLDAQTLLTKTRSDYYNGLSDYNIAKAVLERSMGVIY